MSHHHHRQQTEPAGLKTVEPIFKPGIPLFEKNDLTFLSLIKPLLSPNGQKLVDLILIFNGDSLQESLPDLTSLLSQLNINGENNSIKELLQNLLSSTNNQENKTNPNLAMLSSLINSINQENKPEDS